MFVIFVVFDTEKNWVPFAKIPRFSENEMDVFQRANFPTRCCFELTSVSRRFTPCHEATNPRVLVDVCTRTVCGMQFLSVWFQEPLYTKYALCIYRRYWDISGCYCCCCGGYGTAVVIDRVYMCVFVFFLCVSVSVLTMNLSSVHARSYSNGILYTICTMVCVVCVCVISCSSASSMKLSECDC